MRILQIGADFSYNFTDVSAALVATSRRRLEERHGGAEELRRRGVGFAVLDVEQTPPPDVFLDSYDVVISDNCLRATKDLARSCRNARDMLRHDGGVLCLVELMRPLAWLDRVFGLLDGWWRFEDGGSYPLSDESRWEETLLGAGFRDVCLSDDGSRESGQIRLIVARH